VLKRWDALQQNIRWLVVIAAVVLTLVIAWVLFVPVADWLAHHDVGSVTGPLHETAVDNARGRLLTLGAGLFAAGALAFTARTFYLSREGQLTERYTKAVEQLGSEESDVRIGGIHALARVARDSAKDHPAVMRVLTTFVRIHSHEPGEPPASKDGAHVRLIRPDVQAAIRVIGERNTKYDKPGGLTLTAANLANAILDYGDLSKAWLNDATFIHASLQHAKFRAAHLHHANFTSANLTEADFTKVDLTTTNFTDAIWSEGVRAPGGWVRDSGSGRLKRAKQDNDAPGN
jgi:hypothetical protein